MLVEFDPFHGIGHFMTPFAAIFLWKFEILFSFALRIGQLVVQNIDTPTKAGDV